MSTEQQRELEDMTARYVKVSKANARLRYAAQLAADWINGNSLEPMSTTTDTTTFSDETIITAQLQGEAIKQALLDALDHE